MALLFASASTQYLSVPTPLVTVVGCSMACWVFPTTEIAQQFITVGTTTGSTANWLTLGANANSTVSGSMSQQGSGSSTLPSTATLNTGAWNHVSVVFTSHTSMTVWVNGVALTSAVTSRTPGTTNITQIGAFINGGVLSNYANSAIAYPTIWSSYLLTAGDIATLYNSGSGSNPQNIQPGNIVSFLEMQAGLPYLDQIGSVTWTNHGTPTVVADPFALGAAPTVTAQAATSITASSVTLNGNITNENGGGNSTIQGFTYGLTTGYGSTVQSSGSYTTGAYAISVTGLAPGITYHFSAFATNPGGTGSSTDTTFTTSASGSANKGEVLYNGPNQLSSGSTATGSVTNLFDGDNTTTWTTSTTSAWSGIDCGAVVTLTRVRYTAQPTAEDLSLGSTLNASLSDPTFASPTVLATFSSSVRPSTGTLNNEVDVSPGASYRYYMVKTATGLTFGFADLDFIGTWESGIYSQPVAPVISPPAYQFDQPIVISMSSLTTSAAMYYTTNGTTPTSGSTPYTGPFVISANTQINAIAIDVQLSTPSSRITTSFYFTSSVLYSHQHVYDNRNYRLTSSCTYIFQDPVGGLWYMYSTDQDTHSLVDNQLGVNIYSSSDLRNWTYAGNAMGSSVGSQVPVDYRSVRPHVFYCATTGLYVGWTGASDVQAMRVYTSPYPDGRQQWTLVASYTPGNPCADGFLSGSSTTPGDVGGFVDPSTGNSYIIYNYNTNSKTAFSQLDPSTLTNTLSSGSCATYALIGEAHTIVLKGSTYFYMYSGLTGDAYNANHYSTGSTPIGPWTGSTNPMQTVSGSPVLAYSGVTPSPSNCYAGQTSQIIYIPGRNAFIWMGDDINWSGTGDPYQNTILFLPVTFTSATTFTVSWLTGNYFDGKAYAPWSLDSTFPTVSGAPVSVTNLTVSNSSFSWTNNDPIPSNLYLDYSTTANFASVTSSELVSLNASPPSSYTPVVAYNPSGYYRIRSVNVNGTSASSVAQASSGISGSGTFTFNWNNDLAHAAVEIESITNTDGRQDQGLNKIYVQILGEITTPFRL